MAQSIDERKVFFEGLNAKTTATSLKAYLSKDYQIQICNVLTDSKGENKGFGSAIFSNVANVNKLMANRPHYIDGANVEVYRSVPGQGSLKEKKGVNNLIVSGIHDRLSDSDLKKHFERYGKIHGIYKKENDDFCRIEFIDYDSVDKALLDRQYTILSVKVGLMKGDRRYPLATTTFDIPSKRKYRIHLSNIPSKHDVHCLSRIFNNWPIHNILMRSSNNTHSLTECWLLDVDNQQAAENFIKQWHGEVIGGSRITCRSEEDSTDLCKYFQTDQCLHRDDQCDWQHIKCSEYGTCSISECPYGHSKDLKKTWIDSKVSYRIKIEGFQTELTPERLSELLNYPMQKNCYVNRFVNQVGYIVNLKSIKSAKHFIEKWHNKTINDVHQLKCQLELNICTWTRTNDLNQSQSRNTNDQRSDYGTEDSRDSSCSRDVNDKYRSLIELREALTKLPQGHAHRRESSAESTTSSICSTLQLPDDVLMHQWELTKKVEESEQVLLIRGKTNRKQLAVIKIYQKMNIQDYRKELKALTILQDTNNVSQLMEYSSNKRNSWIVMERAPGRSLAEFIHRNNHHDLTILQAIQLVQQLLILVKHIHSQGIVHRNLEPKNIMIEWDLTKTSIEQAHLTLINFSQAYIQSDKNDSMDYQSKPSWYQSPQANVQGLSYMASIDTSSLCAILFWLITNVVPRHSADQILPHQQDNARSAFEKKISQIENCSRDQSIVREQLKKYFYDTFDVAFGYPHYHPWTMDDLEVRLESIGELLSPMNTNLITIEDISQRLIAIAHPLVPVLSNGTSAYQDIFQTASNAFFEAKKYFTKSHPNHYSWSDGTSTWLNNPYTTINERQHQDILSYHTWNQNTSSGWSFIIICFAHVSDEGNVLTLSIGSPVNGKISRIPIGQYSRAQDYIKEFQENFTIELKYLLISIDKQRKAVQQ